MRRTLRRGLAVDRRLAGVALILSAIGGLPSVGNAQASGSSNPLRLPRINSERVTQVYSTQIIVILPPPYMSTVRPNPPIAGYYAWKISFGGDAEATVVFRTDSAMATSSNRAIIRAGSLYACPSDVAPILSCTTRIRGSARMDSDAVVVEINEPAIVERVKAQRPEVVLRQTFEPGGRYRVDYVQISYKNRN